MSRGARVSSWRSCVHVEFSVHAELVCPCRACVPVELVCPREAPLSTWSLRAHAELITSWCPNPWCLEAHEWFSIWTPVLATREQQTKPELEPLCVKGRPGHTCACADMHVHTQICACVQTRVHSPSGEAGGPLSTRESPRRGWRVLHTHLTL